MFLERELDYIASRLETRLESRLRAIIRQERQKMVDVVADLTAQVGATLDGIGTIVSAVQADVAKLVAAQGSSPVDVQALETLIGNLKTGTDNAVAAVQAAQASLNPPAPAPASAPAPAADPAASAAAASAASQTA